MKIIFPGISIYNYTTDLVTWLAPLAMSDVLPQPLAPCRIRGLSEPPNTYALIRSTETRVTGKVF